MKYKDHKYQDSLGSNLHEINCAIYRTDVCMYCLKSIRELLIDDNKIDLSIEYLRKNPQNIAKCLTEEEYIIKKALE
jgi:hypothetical protein